MSEEKKKLYKILVDGKSCHGGDMAWSLPKGKKPGNWMTVEGNLKICKSGLHLTTEPFKWYKWGCTAYEAEARDVLEWEDDKCVARSVRLLKEVKHPKWWTDCEGWVATLKDIAWLKPDGHPKKEWKVFPSRAAASNAAWSAARAAARDVAWSAASNAVWDAAGAAVWDAASNAASDATRDAAGAAVWDAASNAASDATRDAVGAAVWDAARDAALYARGIIVSDLKLEAKHRAHIQARMEVWKKGYGLYGDVDGVLYVYEKI